MQLITILTVAFLGSVIVYLVGKISGKARDVLATLVSLGSGYFNLFNL